MKKILLGIFLILLFAFTTVQATGDPNIDGGGGGGMGSGSGQNFWNPGYEGIRITIVDANTARMVATPVDWSNKNVTANLHFGKIPKVRYLLSQSVQLSTNEYISYKPSIQMPTIISSNSGGISNMDTIRSYFCSEFVLVEIAETVGMDYDDLVSGAYKITIEPIAYFTFNGVKWAMTATEAAIYDAKIGGKLRAKMVSLTHKNLPLSLFLQRPDLGIQKYTGPVNAAQSAATIIRSLGIGVISFTDPEIEPPDMGGPPGGAAHYTYHTDTEVITSLRVTSGRAITPDDNRAVVFTIDGLYYTRPLIVPPGGEQLVWVRWRTPSTPQRMEIRVTGAVNQTLIADIVALEENEPPDPKYVASSPPFTLAPTPAAGSVTNRQWSVWFARWVPGSEDDSGYWYYWQEHYGASLAVDYTLKPADRVQTAFDLGLRGYEMKSGYGVQANVNVQVVGSSGTSNADITPVQHAVATFSEFGFDTYNRFLEPDSPGAYRTGWQFKENRYSYYRDRVHFSPLWYPDGTDFIVPIEVMDAWTPAGQLYTTKVGRIVIQDSMYDDWYIRILR